MLVFKSLALLLAAVVVLAACGVFNKKAPAPCPRISILSLAKQRLSFAPGGGTDLSAMQTDVRLADARGTCVYREGEVEVEMTVTVAARRGPADRTRKATAPYFVAILSPERRVLAKRVFDLSLQFPVNVDAGSKTDTVVQRIPLSTPQRGPGYRIVTGLQLTRAQLEFNRRRSKTRTPGDLRDLPIEPPRSTGPSGPGGELEYPPTRVPDGGRVPGQGN